MKIAPAQINSFLQKPDPAMRVVLIYGPDAGLVRERAETFAKKLMPDINDPFRTAQLTGAMIAEDPARLRDEMAAQALGGGSRLIRIQAASENIAAALASLLAGPPAASSVLLIEGGDLDKRSKLRALCENDGAAAAIPCYVEEGAQRQRAIADILQAEGLAADRDALALLDNSLPPDRLAMRSELEKLALYVGVKNKTDVVSARSAQSATARTVSLEDVEAIVQDAGAAELDDLIFAVGLGDAKRAALLLDRLLEEQTSPVAILRSAERHFLRLQIARSYVDNGQSAGEAIKKLQPPVFWKYADQMAAQVRRWPAPKIDAALAKLFDAEAAVKRTGAPDEALTSQLLLRLAG
jgi:DNA polymerase III subunit delta